ncbi:hypothetical protein IAT38_004246 [Cryptococcus sp. DSM 104549]
MSSIADSFFHPFSSGALKLLPKRGVGLRAKSKRADRIPDSEDADRPLVSDYHSINDPTIRIRVPKKVPTPVKVEAKVWFANERTFISYLSMGLLLSTIASGLLFGARDSPARWFAFGYALISAIVLIYGWAIYQKRLTMISTRDATGFDNLWGPLLICAAIFVAILVNFVFRLAEAKRHTGINPMSFQNAWYQAGVKGAWIGTGID